MIQKEGVKVLNEKETKIMQALLVSPASIGQVVVGKTLAGLFYILVTAVMIFTISWAEVNHWEMVMIFVIGGGFFSVAAAWCWVASMRSSKIWSDG